MLRGTGLFASYLIGLRDGLEATLVISILVAFLNRSSRRDRLREVWVGVGAAVLVSAAVGVLLTTFAGWLGSGVRMELFEAVTSLLAVALVTCMIFWMRRTARSLKGELANGARSLLDEVATKKVTGEEDRYSHTDLWDFAANVDGSRAAIAALRPVLDARRPDLGPRRDARFAAVDAELAKYRQGDGYVAYTTLQPNQVQLLSGTVNALGEQVSAVPAAIAHR